MRWQCQCRSKLSFGLPYGNLPVSLFLESGVMGVSKKQTAKNKQAIVTAAARLFRERGVDGVGLNELMREAGFTQGGFYNHFDSKDSLVALRSRAACDARPVVVNYRERSDTAGGAGVAT